MLPRQVETLGLLRHVGTFMGTLVRKNEKLARFWHAGTLARKPRWHVDHIVTPARMARDLANLSASYLKRL